MKFELFSVKYTNWY